MRRWLSIAILLLAVLVVVAGGALVFRIVNPPSPPTAVGNKIYVSQQSDTTLEVLPPGESARQPSTGDMIDFNSGDTLTTADTGYGYVQLGFPGQVETYFASSTEVLLRDPADQHVAIGMLLTNGWLLVKLPDAFSADQRLVVQIPEGAEVWVSGSQVGMEYTASIIGIQYLAAIHELYADCLQGQCGYIDATGSHPLPAGAHVSLNGKTPLVVGPGNRSELWQFVPNMIASPTPIPSVTPNLAATQSCRYFEAIGLPCTTGFPTATITPSPTLNVIATQQCKRLQNLGTPCP